MKPKCIAEITPIALVTRFCPTFVATARPSELARAEADAVALAGLEMATLRAACLPPWQGFGTSGEGEAFRVWAFFGQGDA